MTVNLWLLSKNDFSLVTNQLLVSASQLFALLGLILMAVSQMLSTRLRFIENIFGGLDKVYGIHQLLGGLSFVFILNHPTLLAINSLPNFGLALNYLTLGKDLAYNLGLIAIWIMLLAFVFIALVRLPYHIWLWTHRTLGVAFLLAGIHTLLIGSDVGNFLPLKVWVGFFIAIGTLAAVYSLIFYKRFAPRYIYEVKEIARHLDVVTIFLAPKNKALAFDPGQFVYVRFLNTSIGSETHPFSLASAPIEGRLRLSVKVVGDYTLKLANLALGDTAILYGPYGKFGERYKDFSVKKHVWIAGGIGVTPFLSLLRSEFVKPSGKKIVLYYCYRNESEAVFKKELEEVVQKTQGVEFIGWSSATNPRFTAKEAVKHLRENDGFDIHICGPQKMMEDLKMQFLKLGVAESKILFENFQFI